MIQLAKRARSLVLAMTVAGVLAYGAAAAVTVADVIGRQFGMPIEGVVDLVQLFVMAGAWLVMPYAFMEATHVSVDFLLAALPRSVTQLLVIVSALVTLALLAFMLWQGFLTFRTRTMFGDRSQQLGIPIAWYWYPLLVGLAASMIGATLRFLNALRQEAPNE
ncbi:TRAP transporter small permease [Oricola thermophila]|nr:TRAP transporter small permease [Oricola thermophila]